MLLKNICFTFPFVFSNGKEVFWFFFIHHLLWNPNFVWSGLTREYFFVKTIVAFMLGGVIEVIHVGYSQFRVVEKPYMGNGSSVQLRNFSLRNGSRWIFFNVRNTCSSCLDCSDLFSAHQDGFFSIQCHLSCLVCLNLLTTMTSFNWKLLTCTLPLTTKDNLGEY